MTEPQRHKLVAGGAAVAFIGVVLYLIIFGFQAFDPKGFILFVGFFAMAAKIATHKHKRNPLF